jgi:hypothetical protein
VCTCHFRTVSTQTRPKMRAGSCSPPCRDSEHGTALVIVSCRHGPKYFVSCRAVLRVMLKDRAMTRPQMARPKSQLYVQTIWIYDRDRHTGYRGGNTIACDRKTRGKLTAHTREKTSQKVVVRQRASKGRSEPPSAYRPSGFTIATVTPDNLQWAEDVGSSLCNALRPAEPAPLPPSLGWRGPL